MQPLAIHHVSVNVSDVPRGVAFYTDVLGGVRRADRPSFPFAGAWLDFGAQQLHLIEAEVPADRGQHFAIRVERLDDVVVELRAKGVEVSEPSAVGTGRQAFLRDPDGNAVELHEVAAGA